MSIIKSIVAEVIAGYKYHASPKTFFGINLRQLDEEQLTYELRDAVNFSSLKDYEDFIDERAELEAKLEEREDEAAKEIEKKKLAFEQEIIEAKAAFDHNLGLKTVAFEREQELKKLEMEHNEQLFVTDSKFTKAFIEAELLNARKAHDAEIEAQKSAFAAELKAATETMEAEVAHVKTIAQAEIDKARAESEILYTYDATILAKKMQSEISDRYDALVQIASKYEAMEELIARIEADKAYFQSFAEARVNRSEDVTDALVDTLKTKAATPVTVNVSECKKDSKKNK